MSFLILGDAERAAIMRQIFVEQAPDIPFYSQGDIFDPAAIRYMATWTPPSDMADRFPHLELLFSTGAGADQFCLDAIPKQTKLVRLVERNIINGMVDYVSGAVLSLHRDFFAYARYQAEGRWAELPVKTAQNRRVSILGAGELGRAVLSALAPFGFQLAAWSRTPRSLKDAKHYCGSDGLHKMASETDILICLLPLTPDTTGILCRSLFASLPQGAAIINVGRGAHLVEQDLLSALENGQVSQAILDVTSPEPLPQGHPFWVHPHIFLTPHIASVTDAKGAALAMIANIRRHQNGTAPEGLVERTRGY